MKRLQVLAAWVVAAIAIGTICLDRWYMTAHAESAATPLLAATHPAEDRLPAFSVTRGHEGFWRVAKTQDGIWWFLSPDNRLEFLNGVTTVQPTLRGRDPHGPDYICRDWNGREDSAAILKWAQTTLSRVKEIGFKSIGAWSHPALHQLAAPITQDLNVWQWIPYGARLFSSDWRTSAESAIAQQAAPLRDSRNLIGYYIDNELNWTDEAVGARVYFDQLSPDDPNRQEVLSVIRQTWPTLGAFNHDWNTTFADWSELQRHPVLPMGAKAGYEQLEDRWLFHFAQSYFGITTNLIRKYDPNHLVLGCRYRGWAPAAVPRAARGITDAQSLNYYAADAMLDADIFRTIGEESDQPLIISEYSFHSLDGRSGNRNLSQFPALVADQHARSAGYRDITTRLARVPFVIGADWFQWMDEPPSGRLIDGEDANMGIVDVRDQIYESLARAVHQTTPVLNDLHANSVVQHDTTVWRQPPSGARPTQLAGGMSELIAK